MARTARYVLIAEDAAGMRFVERYLVSLGIDSREIKSDCCPKGQSGSGKVWVTKRYPIEVKVFRKKQRHVWKALFVMTDADNLTVEQRKAELAESLKEMGSDDRSREERIILVIPKWEVETWAEHLLRGTNVSEHEKSGWPTAKSEKDCHQAGGLLREHRHRGSLPACCPPSLVASDEEFARLDE